MPAGAAPPITRVSTRPSSLMDTRSIAPSSAGMPQATPPPSNAGPAGQEAASSRSRLPTITSVLVPMSSSAVTSSESSSPVASAQAAASAPTCEPISGRP